MIPCAKPGGRSGGEAETLAVALERHPATSRCIKLGHPAMRVFSTLRVCAIHLAQLVRSTRPSLSRASLRPMKKIMCSASANPTTIMTRRGSMSVLMTANGCSRKRPLTSYASQADIGKPIHKRLSSSRHRNRRSANQLRVLRFFDIVLGRRHTFPRTPAALFARRGQLSYGYIHTVPFDSLELDCVVSLVR